MPSNSSFSADNKIRKKRQLEGLKCRYCYVFFVVDDGLYEACFTINGFDFCHVLYQEGNRPEELQEAIDNFSVEGNDTMSDS